MSAWKDLARREGHMPGLPPSMHPNSNQALREDQRQRAWAMRLAGASYRQIAEDLGVSASHAENLLRGFRDAHPEPPPAPKPVKRPGVTQVEVPAHTRSTSSAEGVTVRISLPAAPWEDNA